MKNSWGRGFAALIAASSLVLGGSCAATAAPQPAAIGPVVAVAKKAPAPVVIKVIPNKTVKGNAKATIKPLVRVNSKKAKLTRQRISVTQGSRTLASYVKSVRLKAGTYKVTTTVKYKLSGKAGIKTMAKKQTLVIKKAAVKKQTWVYGSGNWTCPSGYPIKGNESSMIYHVPGGQYYERTNPEQCFSTTAAARAAGCRASKR